MPLKSAYALEMRARSMDLLINPLSIVILLIFYCIFAKPIRCQQVKFAADLPITLCQLSPSVDR